MYIYNLTPNWNKNAKRNNFILYYQQHLTFNITFHQGLLNCVSWSVSQVYTFLDKMSFYTEAYKHKPNDVISREDGTLWRRQTHKLLYPLGQC